MENLMFSTVKLALSLSIRYYKTQKLDFRILLSPEIEIDFLVLKILLCLLFCASSAEVLRLKNMQCTEQENCFCVKPLLAKHEDGFPP